MNFDFNCIGSRIRLDLPHQIWEAQTMDPTNETLLTRLFHNQVSFAANNYFRCYLSYFSPDFITKTFTIFGLVLFLIGLYYLVKGKKRFFFAILLLAPIFPLFEITGNVLFRGLVLYLALVWVMGYGIWCLIKRKKSR